MDMIMEVSTLASHIVLPREGHLEALFHMFDHLKGRHNAQLVLESSYPEINEKVFQRHDWKNFYGDVKDGIPTDAPEPCREEVELCLYVDSDHAGDKKTRRSSSGFFIFLNSALID